MRTSLCLVWVVFIAGCARTGPEVRPQPAIPLLPSESALSDVRQLTFGFARAGEAYFSPDREWIIFQAVPKGQTNYLMYVAPLEREGGRIVGLDTPVMISPPNSSNTCGYFSPDGGSVIFASTGEQPATRPVSRPATGRSYAWEFNPKLEIVGQHSGPTRTLASTEAMRAPARLTNNTVYDAECAYSPDGKHIVYCSMETGDGDIYIMDRDGSHKARITSAKGYDGGPFFSPDGKRLVYRSDRKGDNKLQVFTVDLIFDAQGHITGSKNERQITHSHANNWAPYWHPDGKHIIYATSRHGHANYELYLIRDDGTHDTRITYWEGADVLPVFSPDGKWLMWTSRRSADGTPQIIIARFVMPEGA